MEALTTSYNKFAVNLYKKLMERNDQNLFFSPMSIASALTMVYIGAKGNTACQMADTLDAVNMQNISQAFEEFSSKINRPDSKYTMKTANGLFSEMTYPIVSYYTQALGKHFHAEIQTMDFLQGAERSRKSINSWVEGQTEGKIKDILAPGSIDSLSRLVLVNAIYFKGQWDNKFCEENTEQKPFKISKTKSKLVPMMFQRNKFNMSYIEELQTKVLELPYANNEISMLILLPDEIKDDTTGLEQLEKELNHEKLTEWTKAEVMEKTNVELELPCIRLENSYDLKSHLNEMGLSDLFNADKADLTGISDKGQLYVSHMIHTTFVEMNEEGTEAAAATAAVVTAKSRPIFESFHANHPFLFMVKDLSTNSIMFLGKFVSP